jgi:hypothetical protein
MTANSSTASGEKVLESQLAGTWYPGAPEQLKSDISRYVEETETAPLDQVAALVLPHAGYRFSGEMAARGLKAVQGKDWKRVVVMGPSHGVRLPNQASLPGATQYATLLGRVPLDTGFMDRLRENTRFTSAPQAHSSEHSVQIQLPLLQVTLGEFDFVPIVIGQLDDWAVREVAHVLRPLLDNDTLVIVSTDFTHFGPRFGYMPFRSNLEANLHELDMGAVEALKPGHPETFDEYVQETGATICGRDALRVLMALLPDDAEMKLLGYTTSGALTGDFSHTVSYVSAAAVGQWGAGGAEDSGAARAEEAVATEEPAEMAPQEEELDDKSKRNLLALARKTLTGYVRRGAVPSLEETGVELTLAMERRMGAFVTLHKHGELRGCIGEMEPRRPLYHAVMAQAVHAGTQDRRFPPVTLTELPEIHFEISALTPPEPVPDASHIEVGRHGVILEKRGRRAVFLPQVAPQQGWDRDTMLSYLSRKAGLPADAWREGADLRVFQALVFSEEEAA